MRRFSIPKLLILSATLLSSFWLQAQPKLEFNLKKPKQFEEKKLPSEKLAEKKFTKVRRFFQNNYTHFNYFFNANLRLNKIIEESKQQSKDDYTKLLPFFPYDLDQTSKNAFIDTVLQKCTAGILLHDLRNDWVDNMYLVMGKAYLLRKDFDSAAMTFQYINYSFSPKEKGGYDKPIGSNADEGNTMSVASKEKKGTFAYVTNRPPSRNEALVWQVRTLTEDSNYLDASSLMETLKNDPVFPERLKEELAEARAYLYYKMEMWDSAAEYLVKAIPLAPNRSEKARDWYLAGQLYQLANKPHNASEAYAKCTDLALDPVMEVYARLNSIRLNKGDDPKMIDQNVASLVSMAKKDKYENYRDIIYYAAGLFEMERNGYDAAKAFLQKSIRYTLGEPQRSRSFMLMGDIDYQRKAYGQAALSYDSVVATGLSPESVARLEQRKPGTHEIYLAEEVINLQDSLLSLSAMEEQQRISTVKQIAKAERKLRGLKEETTGTGSVSNPLANPAGTSSTNTGMFSSTGSSWYFYDANARANGFNKFKERWGGRPNLDNWRRSSSNSMKSNVPAVISNPADQAGKSSSADPDDNFDSTDVSFDNLYSRIPLSDERKQKAEDKITDALYKEGVALHEQLEDYPEAIKVFEKLLSRKDSGEIAEKSLFALVHCYTQIGDAANAARCRQLLQKNFPDGINSQKLQGTDAKKKEDSDKKAATAVYSQIYDLFIEGNFEKAVAEKKKADSSLGKNYWTPQLLYLEAVYYIKQRQDSSAIVSLNNISSQFSTHPLAGKAKKMVEVLRRRKEIEDYLTKLQITRAEEEKTLIPIPERTLLGRDTSKQDSTGKNIASVKLPDIKKDSVAVAKPTVVKKDSTIAAPVVTQQPTLQPKDSAKTGLVVATPTQASPYTISANDAGIVALVLERVDPAYVNEALYSFSNSSRKNIDGKKVEASKLKLKDNLWLVVLKSEHFSSAANMVDYVKYIRPIAKKELLTWLDASKYYYTIISEANLNLLKQDPNMALYQKVLSQTFPGSF